MTRRTPTVRDKIFTLWDYEVNQPIIEFDITDPSEWLYWQSFLDDATTKSFRFIGPEGTSCSVIKELRPQFGDKSKLKPTWYAHRRLGGKLHRCYLGKSENLTYSKLKQVAFELSQRRG